MPETQNSSLLKDLLNLTLTDLANSTFITNSQSFYNSTLVSNFHNFNHSENGNHSNSFNSLNNFTNTNTSISLLSKNVIAKGELTIILLSTLFLVIEFVGIVGNSMVILVVLTNKDMRKSPTNLFITSLAFADLWIMIIGEYLNRKKTQNIKIFE